MSFPIYICKWFKFIISKINLKNALIPYGFPTSLSTVVNTLACAL